MRDRKEQIIKEAIKIVAEEGYGNLSMRAVARASGLKLGALQYHFPHWADLLRGVADYIMDQYSLPAAPGRPKHPVDIVDVVQYIMDDAAGVTLNSERLFPQLWAMAQVEPIMNKLMAEIYGRYIDVLEKILADSGVPHPRVHARLAITSSAGTISVFAPHKRGASCGVPSFAEDGIAASPGCS